MAEYKPAHLRQPEPRRGVGRLVDLSGSWPLLLYYIAFAIYAVLSVLLRTRYAGVPAGAQGLWPTMSRLLQVVILGLLAVKFFTQSFTKRQMAIVLIVLALALVNRVVATWNYLIWIVAFVVTAQGVSVRKLAKISLVAFVPLIVLTVVLSCFGVVENYSIWGAWNRSPAGPQERFSLGFIHPTALGIVCAAACLSALVATKKKRWAWAVLAVSAAVTALVYMITDSRGPVLVMAFAAFLFVLLSISRELVHRWALRAIAAAYGLMLTVTFFGAIFYSPDNPFMELLNTMSSDRLRFSHMFLEQGLLTPFGVPRTAWPHLGPENMQLFGLDNAYFFALASFGWVTGVVILVVIALFLRKVLRERPAGVSPSVLGFSSYLVAGFMEQIMYAIAFNYFAVALASMIYGQSIDALDRGEWVLDDDARTLPEWCDRVRSRFAQRAA